MKRAYIKQGVHPGGSEALEIYLQSVYHTSFVEIGTILLSPGISKQKPILEKHFNPGDI